MRSLSDAGQGRAQSSLFGQTGRHVLKAAAATLALATLASTAAQAFEQTSDRAKRYSDNALVETARRAAQAEAQEQAPVHIGRTPEQQRALEAKREADLARLIDRLRDSDAKIAAKKQPLDPVASGKALPWEVEVTVAPAGDLAPEKRSALGARPSDLAAAADTQETRGRATILLVMNKPADGRSSRAPQPVLCMEYGCYISTGVQAPATFMTFAQATGPFGRIGRGAGACQSSNTCVFRGVEVGVTGSTPVQPVDLRAARPDRKFLRDAVADETCRMISGRLSCSRPVRTEEYTMWVVPERVASAIGPDALSDAVAGHLETAAKADLPWLNR